ncbi:MAG: hypothetical protein HOE90_21915 [Bacteriovoracaceae bacterium]|nr:hypothetical protein [Bacteriovoracaceae bacterium]
MLTKKEIETKVYEVIREKCLSENDQNTVILGANTHLTKDLGLDSLGLLTLSVEVENFYKIYLGDANFVPETVGEVIEVIERETKKIQ